MLLHPKLPDDPVSRDILKGTLVLFAVAVIMHFIAIFS